MSERKWIIRSKDADFESLAARYDIDQVVAKLLVNRDIDENDFESFLYPEKAGFNDPYQIEDMNQAVRIVIHDIEEGHKLRLISKGDADGIISNYILYKGLRRIGADVDYVLWQDEVKADDTLYDGISTFIICNMGNAVEELVRKAGKREMTFVAVDHHQLSFDIEAVGAVLNSKKESCRYPYKELCSAGVAYKFIECLYDKRGIPVEELTDFIEFVAVAVICDDALLTGENRLFVTAGLKKLRQSNNTGLRALVRANELSDVSIDAYHVKNQIGPCIEAFVENEELTDPMELFMEENGEIAIQKAMILKELSGMNNGRDKSEDEQNDIVVDAELPFSYVTEKLISEIDGLAPFGPGNPTPVFISRNVNIVSAKIIGKEQDKVKLVLEEQDGFTGEGIYDSASGFSDNIISWFGQEEHDKLLHGWLNNVVLNVIYYPEIKEFNDARTIQYRILGYSMAAVREVL